MFRKFLIMQFMVLFFGTFLIKDENSDVFSDDFDTLNWDPEIVISSKSVPSTEIDPYRSTNGIHHMQSFLKIVGI